MIRRITTIYFSPTGGTEKIAKKAGETLGRLLGKNEIELDSEPAYEEVNLTLPEARTKTYLFGEGDLLLFVSPVYAGRLPNKILPDYEACIQVNAGSRGACTSAGSHGACVQASAGSNDERAGGPFAIPICVYGNRNWDNAILDAALLLKKKGFVLAGAGAIGSRHAFSNSIGACRPDNDDFSDVEKLCLGAVENLRNYSARLDSANSARFDSVDNARLDSVDSARLDSVENTWLVCCESLEKMLANSGVTDNKELPYYTPLKEDGTPAVFLKARPVTDWEVCDKCGLCSAVCPVGSIDDNTMDCISVCIKCQACVRACPTGAKSFDDADFLSHVKMLEKNYSQRKDNLIVI